MNNLKLNFYVICTILALLSGCISNETQVVDRNYKKQSNQVENADQQPNRPQANNYQSSQEAENRIAHPAETLRPILIEQYQFKERIKVDALKHDIAWFKRNKKFITTSTNNSQRYLYHITRELKLRNMPGEIALLPMIESNFNPTARGPGGHEGLWQFSRDTGKRMKLEYNWWYNGSMDAAASTNAALDYIERLAKHYNGDYLLALAAYNCGSGTLDKIIQRNRKIDPHKNFWSLPLPKYTREHLSKLLALSHIIASPEQYNLSLTDIPNKAYFTDVTLTQPIDLTALAHLTQTSLSEIQALNPGLLRGSTDPLKQRRVYLPTEKAEGIEDKVAQLNPNERFSWPIYQPSTKESLSTIAKKHGTSINTLRTINGLSNQTQSVSNRSVILPSTRIAIADIGNTTHTPNKRRTNGSGSFHHVASGETLSHIAQKYNTSINKLLQMNQLKKNTVLRIGQKIRVKP